MVCGVLPWPAQEERRELKPEIQWEMCTRVLLGDSKAEPAKRSRRLYDVANVLVACQLITKGPNHSHRAPTYQWLGVQILAKYFSKVSNGARRRLCLLCNPSVLLRLGFGAQCRQAGPLGRARVARRALVRPRNAAGCGHRQRGVPVRPARFSCYPEQAPQRWQYQLMQHHPTGMRVQRCPQAV